METLKANNITGIYIYYCRYPIASIRIEAKEFLQKKWHLSWFLVVLLCAAVTFVSRPIFMPGLSGDLLVAYKLTKFISDPKNGIAPQRSIISSKFNTLQKSVRWHASVIGLKTIENRKRVDDITLPRGESVGQAVLEAIEESHIAVIVFSKNYADSSWCLDELLHIMKCRAENGQIVILVFYDVDPSDVRKQKGESGKAFAKQEAENVTKAESWRKALVDASNISGWEPKKIERTGSLFCYSSTGLFLPALLGHLGCEFE
ncbi:toll/interleukin-1 receptor (TIR) domain-containing protein [Artemisia annua]|uniref:Toll/interleukin-1 receptor (TIR) domain-containing protein n=1 Tax=Artemisia annua TaxID=35608 RepID=A0A2U1MRJ5_ARTAN|nr:toll/interleukin-1 receptor (TIR) domain-containing protein [Artemisia annua]